MPKIITYCFKRSLTYPFRKKCGSQEEHCANLLENLKKARTTNPHRYLLIDELTDIISVACGLKKRADLDTTQEIEQATDCDTDDDANSLDGAQIIWNNQTPEEPPKEDDLDECSQPYSP